MGPEGLQNIRIAVPDLNGQARAKRVPAAQFDKMMRGEAKMPLSALNLDIWGNDIEGSPLVFATGDADGYLRPTERGLLPMPWIGPEAAMLPMWMYHEDGRPFEGDPRHALAAVVARLKARDLHPVTATELEFYLIDDSGPEFLPPASPVSGRRAMGAATLSMRMLDEFNAFFDALYAGCDAMGIEADTATSEAGPGQFEINLNHGVDPLKMADDTWLFKILVRRLARQHGMAASFMAKPYPGASGNGLHIHASLLDGAGRNVFDNGGPEGSEMLHHAIGGVLAAMPASTLIFAPHFNSYERLVPHAHAPTGVCWAYENRTASVRVPLGAPKARRLEHRTAGGDVNPYLMMAAVLGAMLAGIEDQTQPPAPVTGDAYALDLRQIPATWSDALDLFSHAPEMTRIFVPMLIDNMCRTKRQEMAGVKDMSDQAVRELYLESV
ncbi:glutamine synthetase family protein [Roseinatronobacter bogoriensis]|uniref:Glutamine synthetase n=1 Tax=Roseinatronobacter bogoriensis subsp. barguzinensis TaxID=441209 RepID=A0A2K8KG15_9RHOB|nr:MULTISPECIES: glutamine synthetase family protein [Rhodobaca]ATX66923.1 glutamine synthetase [Rhodobaca barguzinensis]TDW41150.1 glutamine synthetase [Rhodobaca barguzinensis]TDY74672.1 glutamate--putrescine ligase [Rhodobaca bogoriensis DSM 18756]